MSMNGAIDRRGITQQSMTATVKDLDAERMRRYSEALEFFDGTQWRERQRGRETQLVMNYARSVVRKAVSYMFNESPVFAVVDDAGAMASGSEAAGDVLNRIHEQNNIVQVDPNTALDAAVMGDGAFKVTWSPMSRQVVISPVDPQGLWAWWHPENPSQLVRVVQLRHISREEARTLGLPLPANETPTTLASSGAVSMLEEWTAETYKVEVNGGIVVNRRNPYGWIPYTIFANERQPQNRWGQSDLVDLFDVTREFNSRMSTIAAVLRLSGAPIAVLENVTGADGIEVRPGAVWELPPDAKAYLLDLLTGGGVGLHIDYIGELRTVLHDLSETPRTSYGDSGRSLSGVALEVEVQPLIQKVNRKRRVWERVYDERNRMALDLAERFGGESVGGLRRTRVEWGATLPADREALVREVGDRIAHGTLTRVAGAGMLGAEDPEMLVDDWLAEARRLGAQEQEREEDGGNDGDTRSDTNQSAD